MNDEILTKFSRMINEKSIFEFYLEYPFFPLGGLRPLEIISIPSLSKASSSASPARLEWKERRAFKTGKKSLIREPPVHLHKLLFHTFIPKFMDIHHDLEVVIYALLQGIFVGLLFDKKLEKFIPEF